MTRARLLLTSVAVLTLSLGPPTLAAAQPFDDGRLGPVVFSDAALDQSLAALNDFLKKRHSHDEMMAAIAVTPAKDFATTSNAVAEIHEYRESTPLGGFGANINSGVALDLHLAALNEELSSRGDPLFVLIPRAAGGTDLDMREAGGMPPMIGDLLSFGPTVEGGATLDFHLDFLSEHILEQARRQNQLNGDGSVTGQSFDLYGDALKIF